MEVTKQKTTPPRKQKPEWVKVVAPYQKPNPRKTRGPSYYIFDGIELTVTTSSCRIRPELHGNRTALRRPSPLTKVGRRALTPG